jgi:hypothetical protein
MLRSFSVHHDPTYLLEIRGCVLNVEQYNRSNYRNGRYNSPYLLQHVPEIRKQTSHIPHFPRFVIKFGNYSRMNLSTSTLNMKDENIPSATCFHLRIRWNARWLHGYRINGLLRNLKLVQLGRWSLGKARAMSIVCARVCHESVNYALFTFSRRELESYRHGALSREV